MFNFRGKVLCNFEEEPSRAMSSLNLKPNAILENCFKKIVEGLRYRDHCRCQMDVPSQLKMILPLFDLQKMCEQGVRTYHPMVLLAFISNILIFSLGPSFFGKECLPSFIVWGPFIVSGALSPFNGGKTFWLVMMMLRWRQGHHYPAGDC